VKITVLTILVASALAVAIGAEARVSGGADPPRLVLWHMVGNAGLGMTETRIKYSYDQPTHAYTDNGFDYRIYQGRGEIGVAYDRSGHLVWVDTSSPAYRTPDDFGVGSRIPLGPCHKVKGKCEYRWRFLTLGYGEGGINVWTGATRWAGNLVNVRIEMRANRVGRIAMYVNRPRVCYPFYVTCDGIR
jgi:hypothetical protein